MGNSDIVIGRVLGIHVNGEYITPDGVSGFVYSGISEANQHGVYVNSCLLSDGSVGWGRRTGWWEGQRIRW